MDEGDRLRRRARVLTAGLVLLIVLIAGAVMVPAALHSWRAYGR